MAVLKNIRTFFMSTVLFITFFNSTSYAAVDISNLDFQNNVIDTPKAINGSDKPQFADRANLVENIDPQSGSLTLTHTDLFLPGRDGLDLTLKRIYESSQAQLGSMKSEFSSITDNNSPYYMMKYYLLWAFVGTYPDGTKGRYIELIKYKDETTARAACDAYRLGHSSGYVYTECTVFPTDGKKVQIGNKEYERPKEQYKDYIRKASLIEPTSYVRSRYDLGAGWAFGFPSVEKVTVNMGVGEVNNSLYFHDGNGRSYLYDSQDTTNLNGYETKDVLFKDTDASYSNGQTTSFYSFTDSDKRRSYFAYDGRLLGMKDRFNNEIKFTYVDRNINNAMYPVIDKISDSVGRTVKFNYENKINDEPFTGENITVEVSEPNNPNNFTKIIYTKMRDKVDNRYEPKLWKVTYAEGSVEQQTEIGYEYQLSDQRFRYGADLDVGNSYVGASAKNKLQLLSKVIYPNSVSFYEYEPTVRLMGAGNQLQAYRVKHRYDQDRTTTNDSPSTIISNNLALNKNVTTSSDYSEYSGERAVDGENITEYHSDSYWQSLYRDNYWIKVDLGSPKLINEVIAKWVTGTPISYEVRTSLDDANWTTVSKRIQFQPNERDDHRGFSVDARYVMLQCIGRSDMDPPGLYELEVYNRTGTNSVSYTYKGDYANSIPVDENRTYNYLVSKADASGSNQVYLYNNEQQLTNQIVNNINGERKESVYTYHEDFDYDFKMKPIKVSDFVINASGNVNRLETEYSYNSWGGIKSATKPLNLVDFYDVTKKALYTTNYEYDDTYHFPSKTESKQSADVTLTTQTTYFSHLDGGKAGRLKSQTNANGEVTNYDYELNGNGKVVKVISTKTLEYGTTSRTETEYGSQYQNAFPTIVRTFYTNEAGQWVSSETRSNYNLLTGQLISTIDANNKETTYSYDLLGRPTSVKSPAYTGKNGVKYQEESITEYARRATSTLFDLTNSSLNATKVKTYTKVTYTENNQVQEKKFNEQESYYNAYGKLLLQLQLNGSGSLVPMMQNYFDTMNRPIYSKGPAADEITTLTYDTWGRVSDVIDPYGVLSKAEYDLIGRKQTTYIVNNQSYRANPSDLSLREQVVETIADEWGQVLSQTTYPNYPDQSVLIKTSSAYDIAGNIVNITDPKGYTTTFGFDKLNRLTKITDPLQQISEYRYTKLGNISSIEQGDAQGTWTVTKGYDERGLITRKTGEGDESDEIFVYDTLGRLNKYTDLNAVEFINGYDERSRQTLLVGGTRKVSTTYNEAPFGPQQLTHYVNSAVKSSIAYEYNAVGQVTAQTVIYDNLTHHVENQYNGSGKFTAAIDPFGFATLYKYDKSRPVRIQTNGSSVPSENPNDNAVYDYDGIGKLLSITYPALSGGIKSEYTYDKMGRLKQLTNKRGSVVLSSFVYGYDFNSNIQSITDGTGTTQYVYDKLNRLIEVHRPGNRNVIYQYDSRGNRETLQSDEPLLVNTSANFTYNEADELINSIKDGIPVDYQYDANGLRIKKTTPVETVRYVYDGNGKLIAESNVYNQVQTHYIWGPDRLLVKQDRTNGQNVPYYYLYNGHGDVVQIVDANGTIKNNYSYDEWGNIQNQSESIKNSFKYAGETYDEETGLYYLRARYYDPSVGRFINKDTYEGDIKNPLSLNLYTYVHNNPLKYTDPTGHWCRATIDGTTYSHDDNASGAPCDDPSHYFKTPDELKAILDDPSKRIDYVNRFFKNHKGAALFGLIKMNYGKDVVEFMNWENDTGRLEKSAYWSTANAQMIGDMWFTEHANEYEGWTREEKQWKSFIDNPKQDSLWSAHNTSIAAGSNFAISQGLLKQEPQAEQVFVVMVLFRVGVTQDVNGPSWAGAIGNAMKEGSPFEYPWHYPATWDDPALLPFWGILK